jgi:hypothetical protein
MLAANFGSLDLRQIFNSKVLLIVFEGAATLQVAAPFALLAPYQPMVKLRFVSGHD